MLTEDRVADLIARGRIDLSYHWDPRSGAPALLEQPKVDAGEPGLPSTQVFRDAFFGDRLRLTMGPLVVSHRYARLHGRSNYRGIPSVYDLRETDGRLEIRPGESITINTIENVRLDGSVGAITLPRLTHATAGLVLSPSYIDPFWHGVLVLNLVNQNRKSIEIRFGERIAQTFFFELDGPPLPDSFARDFESKSHHYGMSWARIEDGGDPFPLRKGPVPSRRRAQAEQIGRLVFNRLTAAGLGVVVIAGVLIGFGQLSEKVSRIDDLEQRVTVVERKLAVSRERERALREAVGSIRRQRYK